MMKALSLLLCFLIAGCSTFESRVVEPPPSSKLFASIRLTNDAFSGVEKRRTGFFLYINTEYDSTELVGCHYQYNKINLSDAADVFSSGSKSVATIAAIRAVDLQPFDFDAEAKSCDAIFRKEAQTQGKQYFPSSTDDGAEYEIVVITTRGQMKLQRWNPGHAINFYADHSSKIAKLKTVLDILAQYYGRLDFGL